MELGAYSARSGRKGMGFDTMVMAGGNGSGSDGFASEDAMAVGGRPSQGSDRSERQLVKDIRGAGGTGWTNVIARSESRVATHHSGDVQRSDSGIMADRAFDMQVGRRA